MNDFYKVFLNEIGSNPNYLRMVESYSQSSNFEKYTIFEVISQNQKNCIQSFGNFLDVLNLESKVEVANNLIDILVFYNMELYYYNSTNEQIYVKEENGEKGRIDFSKKRKRHVKIAKDFRATLYSHKEKYSHIVNDYEALEKFIKSGKWEDRHPYDLMVQLVDDYIKDLENKIYDISDRDCYNNLSKKPSKIGLSNYLKEIVKKYNIKGGVRKVNTLITNLDILN
jgi:hypothetical protein